MADINTDPKLIVKVYISEKTIFEGEVDGVSAVNKKGAFDILLDHTNFITVIQDRLLVFQESNEKEFPLSTGILRCFNNTIEVFIGVDATSALQPSAPKQAQQPLQTPKQPQPS